MTIDPGSRPAQPLTVRVFGGLSITVDGREVTLGGVQRRRVASLLTAHAPGPVRVDQLVDCLDPDASSANPLNAVQAHIRRLRSVVEPGVSARSATRLVSSADGYALIPDEMDLWEFHRVLGEADSLREVNPKEAAKRYGEALAMWSDPWGDLGDDLFLVAETTGLRSQLMCAEEHWAATIVSVGVSAAQAEQLLTLARREPTREQRWVSAMQGLYQVGRQAESLRCYEEARRYLRDELGLDPGEHLSGMHHRVLGQDPTLLSRPTEVRGMAPHYTTTYVGRTEELRRLTELTERSRLVTITGLRGSGKTRLAHHWLIEHCATPHAVWVNLQRSSDFENADEALRRALGIANAGEEALRQSTALWALSHDPTIVVLDGIEDHPSDVCRVALELLEARPRVHLLLTAHSPVGLPGEELLALGPLTLPENDAHIGGTAVELAQQRLGSAESIHAAARLARRCAGLPLAIEVEAARLHRFGAITTGGNLDNGESQLDLKDVVERAVAFLSPAARRLLRAMCVLPAGMSMDAIAWLCENERSQGVDDPHEDQRLTAELVNSTLVRAAPTRHSVRYRVREQVVTLAGADMTEGDAVAAQEAMVAWVSERLGASGQGPHPGMDRERRDVLLEDIDNIERLLAFLFDHDALGYADLAFALVPHLSSTAWRPKAAEWVNRALTINPLDRDRAAMGTVASVMLEADLAGVAGRSTEIRTAHEVIGSGDLRRTAWWFVVNVQLAIAAGWNGQLDSAHEHLLEAERAAGDKAWENAVVDRYRALVVFADGKVDEALRLATDSADRLEALGDTAQAVGALYFAVIIARTSNADEYGTLLERARVLVSSDDSIHAPLILSEAAQHAQATGDPMTTRIMQQAITQLEAVGLMRTAATTRRDLGLLRLSEGALLDARRQLLQSAEALLELDPTGASLALGGLSACERPNPGGYAPELSNAAWTLSRSHGSPLTPGQTALLTELTGPMDARIGAGTPGRGRTTLGAATPDDGTIQSAAIIQQALSLLTAVVSSDEVVDTDHVA